MTDTTAQMAPQATVGTDGVPDMRRKISRVDENTAQIFHVPNSSDDVNRGVSYNQIVFYYQKYNDGQYCHHGRTSHNNRDLIYFETSFNDAVLPDTLLPLARLMANLSLGEDKRYHDAMSEILQNCVKPLGYVTGDGLKANSNDRADVSHAGGTDLKFDIVNITHSGSYQVQCKESLYPHAYITIGTPMRYAVPYKSEWTRSDYFLNLKHPEDNLKLTMYAEPICIDTDMKHLKTVIHSYLWGEPRLQKMLMSNAIGGGQSLQPLFALVTNLEKLVAQVMVRTISNAIRCRAIEIVNPLAFRDVFMQFETEFQRLQANPGDIAALIAPGGQLSSMAAATTNAVAFAAAARDTVTKQRGAEFTITAPAAPVDQIYANPTGNNFDQVLMPSTIQIFIVYQMLLSYVKLNHAASWSDYTVWIDAVIKPTGAEQLTNAQVRISVFPAMVDLYRGIDLSWMHIPTTAELTGAGHVQTDWKEMSEMELHELRRNPNIGDAVFNFIEGLLYTTDATGTRPIATYIPGTPIADSTTIGCWGSLTNKYIPAAGLSTEHHAALLAENFEIILSQLAALSLPVAPDQTKVHGHAAEGFTWRMEDTHNAQITNLRRESETKLNYMVRTILRRTFGAIRLNEETELEAAGFDWTTGVNVHSKYVAGSSYVDDTAQDFGWFDKYIPQSGPDLLAAISHFHTEDARRVRGIVKEGGDPGFRANVYLTS